MRIQNAAPLVYTRTKNAGFRKGFIIQPTDITDSVAEKFVEYVHDAMDSIAEMRSSHRHTRIVIAEDGFVILGVSAYLRDMVKDGWEGTDKGGRLVYGFFGYVWHKRDFTLRIGFPSMEEFSAILDSWIRPHWEDSPNSKWADTLQISSYTSSVTIQKPVDLKGYCPETFRGRTVIDDSSKEDYLIQWALNRASVGEDIRVCTNACVYSFNDFKMRYQYVTHLKEIEADKSSRVFLPALEPEKNESMKAPCHEKKKKVYNHIPFLMIAPGVICIGAVLILFVMKYNLYGWLCLLLGASFVLTAACVSHHSKKKPEKILAQKKEEELLAPISVKPEKQSDPKVSSHVQKRETTEDVFRL